MSKAVYIAYPYIQELVSLIAGNNESQETGITRLSNDMIIQKWKERHYINEEDWQLWKSDKDNKKVVKEFKL